MTFLNRVGIGLLLSIILITGVAHAQIRSATITGTVSDPSGAVLPNADVTLIEQQTGSRNATKTTETGLFVFPYLPAGVYTVAVEMQAFVPYKQTGINLTTAQTLRVDVALKMGTVESAIEVAAQAAQIQTDTSTVQAAIQSNVIEALANPTQNPLYYAMLQAGVVPRNATGDTTTLNSFGIGVDGRRSFSAVGVNGGRAFTNDIQLDGLPVMGGGYNEASVIPNTEGLQEVRVIANNFSAEYGRGQAVLAMSTRSGTNKYHGEGTYRIRNEALQANTSYNNAFNIYRPAFKVHELGGAIGGPILKDKLFFFASYHFLRYNYGSTLLRTVPTALERVGNFSQTNINVNGAGVPAAIYDPWNVTQLGPDLFQRQAIPNAIIPSPNASGLLMYSYYPDPNRTPDDVFNTNNFAANVINTVRRHSNNDRIDYRHGKHSIYGSGGISKADVVNPRAFGKAPFNDASDTKSDKNPYAQIGDTIVATPTFVVDMRYGLSRIQTRAIRGNKTGWDAASYAKMGVPANIQSMFIIYGSAPGVNPNGFSGGAGGGSNWYTVSDVGFGNKREQQTNHSWAVRATKIRGSWTHKFGMEMRNLLSNYQDMEEQSAQLPSSYYHVGGNFNFQYVTAAGGVASQNTSNAQKGINAAAILLGAPSWFIRPGANVTPAFSQKYFGFYSQNDWRATAKLTLNLGLRWDLQPGPTERYNRMSASDRTAKNPFGYLGAVAFPGVGDYSRNLWDTQYNNWGPRLGFAYQMNDRTVLRGGYGITYLPSNSGYFSGPTDYGSQSFSSGTNELPYGTTPNGVPVMRFSDTHPLALAVGADPGAAIVYGISDSRFDRFYKNGKAMQWNFFMERRLSAAWFVSAGYSASHSTDLMNRSFAVNSLQLISQSVLDSWRQQYIASNGVTNPANLQVTNPYQPSGGPLRSFTGVLGSSTVAQQYVYYPYPLLGPSTMSGAWADYHSLQLRLSHAFAHSYHLDLNYTWSKEIDNTDNMEDNQGFNSGGTAQGPDLRNYQNNRRIGFSDVPHRFAAVFLVDLPLGAGKAVDSGNRVVNGIIGGWQTAATWTWQAGMPFAISGASTNAAYTHPDQLLGVPLEVPAELQHWYDGNTTVTLPNGRKVKPAKNTFLKYYSGAFAGRYVVTPNGSTQPDVYWYGTAGNTFNELRNPGRFNIDMSLRKTFKIREGPEMLFAAECTNVMNHTQLSGSFTGALGNTQTAVNASQGLLPGMGQSETFGTIPMNTFPPREIVMSLRIKF